MKENRITRIGCHVQPMILRSAALAGFLQTPRRRSPTKRSGTRQLKPKRRRASSNHHQWHAAGEWMGSPVPLPAPAPHVRLRIHKFYLYRLAAAVDCNWYGRSPITRFSVPLPDEGDAPSTKYCDCVPWLHRLRFAHWSVKTVEMESIRSHPLPISGNVFDSRVAFSSAAISIDSSLPSIDNES